MQNCVPISKEKTESVPHVVVTPNHETVSLMLLNCNVAAVRNIMEMLDILLYICRVPDPKLRTTTVWTVGNSVNGWQVIHTKEKPSCDTSRGRNIVINRYIGEANESLSEARARENTYLVGGKMYSPLFTGRVHLHSALLLQIFLWDRNVYEIFMEPGSRFM